MISRARLTTLIKSSHLSIQVKKVEAEQAYADEDIFDFHILTFSSTEFLEWHELCGILIDGNRLGVQDKGLGALFDALSETP